MTTPIQISNYELSIDNLKVALNGFKLAFTAEVYPSCTSLKCTADKDQDVKSHGGDRWGVYDQLMVRHWDRYLTEKVSHIFSQEIRYIE